MGDEAIEELLDRWEEARDRGESPTAEELCADRPELVPELARRIAELRAADAFLGGPDDTDRTRLVTPGPTPAAGPPTAELLADRYRDERFLAEGGLGRVYVARDAELPRDVALKRLQDRLLASAEGRRRFVLEAEITSRLEHPGVVPIYGLGVDRRGHPYYAMRLIRGETIADAIERFHQAVATPRDPGERALAFQSLLRAFLAACQTVAYAHSRGVIHRDIKPSNLMLGAYGEALVVDWGLAKAVGPGAETDDPLLHPAGIEPTQAGAVKGSPVYMSPEQAAGQTDRVGPASDVYSLGATLYTLLAGVRPFDGTSAVEVLAKVRAGQFAPPRQVNPGVPRALEAVCLKAMSNDPADRYAGASEMAADIERWLSGEPVAAYREPWYDRLRRWRRRHRVLVTSAAAAVAVGAVVLALTNAQLRLLAQRLDLANGQLRAALDAAERNLYARDLDLADRSWWDGRPGPASAFLAECPVARRGWEWHYLARRNRPGLLGAKVGGGHVASLAFVAPDRVAAAGRDGLSTFQFPSAIAMRTPLPGPVDGRVTAVGADGRAALVAPDRPREVVVVRPEGEILRIGVPESAPGRIEALAFARGGSSLALVVVRRGTPDRAKKEKISFLTEFEGRVVLVDTDQPDPKPAVSAPFTASGTPAAPVAVTASRVFCPVLFGTSGRVFVARSDPDRAEVAWPRAGGGEAVHALAVSPDGRLIAAACDDLAVRVDEMATGRELAALRGHSGRIRILAFSGDGARLASAGDDRTVRVWDLARGEALAVLRGQSHPLDHLAFSADGARLATSGADELIVWEADHGSEASALREPERPHLADIAVGPATRAAVVAGHQLGWRDATTGRPLAGAELADVDAVAAAPLGHGFAAARGDGTIALFDEAGKPVRELPGHRSRVTSLAFDRDGRRLASASRDGSLRVWETASGRTLLDVQAEQGPAPVVALDAVGALLAFGGDGPEVVVRELSSGRVLHRLRDGTGPPVRRLAFRPDGSALAVLRSAPPGPDDQGGAHLTVWDFPTEAISLRLDGSRFGPTDAAFSPDGLRLATADPDGEVIVWETATGRPLLTLRGPRGPVAQLVFTPDGHRLLAAGGRVDPLGLRTEETEELTIWDGRPLDRSHPAP